MQNPVESLGFDKCYSLSNFRPLKSPSNSIRYNCQNDGSRFLMTFLTILGVTEILCSFRFVPEGKTGKKSSRDLSHQDQST